MNTLTSQATTPVPLYASLFGDIGRLIEARQSAEGWGFQVIPKLSLDSRNELPEEKEFSERNIKRMLTFYREYKELAFVPQAVAQIEASSKVPQAVAKLGIVRVGRIEFASRANQMFGQIGEHFLRASLVGVGQSVAGNRGQTKMLNGSRNSLTYTNLV